MKAHYFKAMDALHRACVFFAGVCLVVITLIIPYGVFTRYVLNSASSWPEPMAILLMIVLSFLSAVVCYREHLHIGVGLLPAVLRGVPRVLLGVVHRALHARHQPVPALVRHPAWCSATWYQSIAEFPLVSVGVSYLPVPIGGCITVLFIVERFLKQDWFQRAVRRCRSAPSPPNSRQIGPTPWTR